MFIHIFWILAFVWCLLKLKMPWNTYICEDPLLKVGKNGFRRYSGQYGRNFSYLSESTSRRVDQSESSWCSWQFFGSFIFRFFGLIDLPQSCWANFWCFWTDDWAKICFFIWVLAWVFLSKSNSFGWVCLLTKWGPVHLLPLGFLSGLESLGSKKKQKLPIGLWPIRNQKMKANQSLYFT